MCFSRNDTALILPTYKDPESPASIANLLSPSDYTIFSQSTENGTTSSWESGSSDRWLSWYVLALNTPATKREVLKLDIAGIGASIVNELARRGASLAFTYSSSSSRAQAMLSDLKKFGIRAIAIQADSADATVSAKKVVEQVVASFGRIDIIVNNAGNGDDHALSDVTEEEFDRIFHVNLLFPVLLVQQAVPYLQQKARIVNVGSVTGRIGKHKK